MININLQIMKSEKNCINKNNLRNFEAFYVNKAFIKNFHIYLKMLKIIIKKKGN